MPLAAAVVAAAVVATSVVATSVDVIEHHSLHLPSIFV